MTEKRYIYASVGRGYEILDSWFGYIGDEAPTEREMEEYDFLVIGLAPDQDSADGICRRLNDQQDEINHLSNFGLHVMLDKKNKEIEQLRKENQRLSEQKHIYKQDWKHLCIDKELLDSENEQLKQQIKDLRLKVLDSIHEANDIQCSCNPCVVEECVKKVVE